MPELIDQALITIQRYHKILSENFKLDKISKKSYNYEFSVLEGKRKFKVQVYFGKKGVKTVLQGDKNSQLYNQLNELLSGELKLNFIDPEFTEPEEYAGSDESGKGDFFGPLAVAAVFVDKSTKRLLQNIGVQDSKNLSDFQIRQMSKEIRIISKNKFAIVKVFPKKYNELYKKFGNLNLLLGWMHSKAIAELYSNCNFSSVIVDKFTNKEIRIPSEIRDYKIEFVYETKAEKYTAVAAASILARDTFSNWFENQKKNGIILPKGASDEVISSAKNIIRKFGEQKLEDFAKMHFKTIKKII